MSNVTHSVPGTFVTHLQRHNVAQPVFCFGRYLSVLYLILYHASGLAAIAFLPHFLMGLGATTISRHDWLDFAFIRMALHWLILALTTISDHDHSPKTDETSMKTDQEAATIVDQDELQLVKSLQPRMG